MSHYDDYYLLYTYSPGEYLNQSSTSPNLVPTATTLKVRNQGTLFSNIHRYS